MKSHDGHSEESEVIKEFRHEKNTSTRFHFYPFNYFNYFILDYK